MAQILVVLSLLTLALSLAAAGRRGKAAAPVAVPARDRAGRSR